MTEEIHEEVGSVSMLGRRLGRYACLRELGSGGMAVLYLARRTGAKGFTKVFALKRIKPKYAADPSFTRMFLREAKLSASLDHPNIAQVIDFGQDGQEHFLVMEYVHGPDLRKLLRSSEGGRLPLSCAMSVMTRICAALHYAHEKTDQDGTPLALVHRDVSPTNVLLSMDGAIKLTDFGIAKAFGDEMSGTSSGILVGKPGYMSPEQVRTEPLDRRSDVFSLGILLYEMTTGHRCFFGDNVFEILNATQRGAFVLPCERDPEYPEALQRIVVKALASEVDARYASARELQLALEEFALDQRLRTSDSVLCDYLASLDLALGDSGMRFLDQVAAEADVRDADGTAFMISGVADDSSRTSKASSARLLAGWIGGGLVAVVVATAVARGTPREPAVVMTSEVAADTSGAGTPEASVSPAVHGSVATDATSTGAASAAWDSDGAGLVPVASRSQPLVDAPAKHAAVRQSHAAKKNRTHTKKPRKPAGPTAKADGATPLDLDALSPPSRRSR